MHLDVAAASSLSSYKCQRRCTGIHKSSKQPVARPLPSGKRNIEAFATLLAQVLRDKLLAEAEESVRLNADVAARWAQLFRLEVPQELHQEMQSQQAGCDEIIASKDAIVADMRAQLHQKDDEYVRMLKQQGEDVDSLLASMQKQLEEMQEAYRDELMQIDEAYMQVVI